MKLANTSRSGRNLAIWRAILCLCVILLCLTLAGMYVYYHRGMLAVDGADEVTQYERGRELFVNVLRWGLTAAVVCVWLISLARRMIKKYRNQLKGQ